MVLISSDSAAIAVMRHHANPIEVATVTNIRASSLGFGENGKRAAAGGAPDKGRAGGAGR